MGVSYGPFDVCPSKASEAEYPENKFYDMFRFFWTESHIA